MNIYGRKQAKLNNNILNFILLYNIFPINKAMALNNMYLILQA